MKNVRDNQLKRCIFKVFDEFQRDISRAISNDVHVSCDYDGLNFERVSDEDISNEEILAALSKYYDVEVTSIHADDFEYTGVWIVYRI